MKRANLISHIVIASLFVFVGCSDDDPVTPVSNKFTVSGTVQIKPGMSVPDSAKLIGIWSVSSGTPDYGYAFGKGTVDFNLKTFSISFDEVPPALALNDYSDEGLPSLGVGMIFLVDLKGADPQNLQEIESLGFYGGISNVGIIYVGGDPSKYSTNTGRTWPKLFPSGYGIGLGVEQQTGFDTFEPSNAPLILRVTDDLSEIVFPNWT